MSSNKDDLDDSGAKTDVRGGEDVDRAMKAWDVYSSGHADVVQVLNMERVQFPTFADIPADLAPPRPNIDETQPSPPDIADAFIEPYTEAEADDFDDEDLATNVVAAKQFEPAPAPFLRIAFVGNMGGGKSAAATAVSRLLAIPLFEVGLLEFIPGGMKREASLVQKKLDQIIAQPRWILDGLGPWPSVEKRCQMADTIVLVDLPPWEHFLRAAQAQVEQAVGKAKIGNARAGLSKDAEDIFRSIWEIHCEVRPKLLALLESHEKRARVRRLKSRTEIQTFLDEVGKHKKT